MTKILIAGSNHNNNDLAKEQAIAILISYGFDVYSTRDIYRDPANSDDPNKAVIDRLLECDIFYVIASQGFTGLATAARIGIAFSANKLCISSHRLTDPDLDYYFSFVIEPVRFQLDWNRVLKFKNGEQ